MEQTYIILTELTLSWCTEYHLQPITDETLNNAEV